MKTLLSNCNVIDVKNGCEILQKKDLYISDGKIQKITDHGTREIGFDAIDCTGKYVLPGLINMHVHLFGTGKPSKALGGGKAQKRLVAFINTKLGRFVLSKMVEKSAKQMLLSGVTTVRSVGDLCYSDILLKKKIQKNKGGARGLRLLVSGPAVTAPGGHGDGTFAISAQEPEELKKIVRNIVDEGADLIKICVTGGVMDAKKRGEPGEVKMTAEQVKAVCDEAHRLNKKVAAHVQSKNGVRIAALNGVDTIEHGATFDEESLAEIKNRSGAMILTYSPALPNALLSHEVTKLNELCMYNSKVVMEQMTLGAAQLEKEGVKVGLGTDSSCPLCTQYNTWLELVYYCAQTGASEAQAIKKATLTNAEILGIDEITGSVEEGKSADLLIVNDNPLSDLKTLKNPFVVIAQGRVLKNPRPKRIRPVEEQLETLAEVMQK